LTSDRNEYYRPEDIFGDVQELVTRVKKKGEKIDYFTFVADGEPTLDINLGNEIDLLRLLDHRIAILTNGSLITKPIVHNELMKADYVSIKIDTTEKSVWRKINRPSRHLNLETILDSILRFSDNFKGKLTTETMLIDSVNTNPSHLQNLASFISELRPNKSYVAIPIRPTAENCVRVPTEATINLAYQIFSNHINTVENLIDQEGDDFGFSGDIENDLLNIASVHPLQLQSVKRLLKKANANWQLIERLISEDRLKEVEYAGNKFYIRSVDNLVIAKQR